MWLNIMKFWLWIIFNHEQIFVIWRVYYKIQDFLLIGQKYLWKYFIEHHNVHFSRIFILQLNFKLVSRGNKNEYFLSPVESVPYY